MTKLCSGAGALVPGCFLASRPGASILPARPQPGAKGRRLAFQPAMEPPCLCLRAAPRPEPVTIRHARHPATTAARASARPRPSERERIRKSFSAPAPNPIVSELGFSSKDGFGATPGQFRHWNTLSCLPTADGSGNPTRTTPPVSVRLLEGLPRSSRDVSWPPNPKRSPHQVAVPTRPR